MLRWPKKEAKIKESVPEIKPKEIVHEEVKEEKKEMPVLKQAEPVKEKLEPLQPGQKYFESPDGEVIIGEIDKQQIWYRKGNNGKGCFINPRRDGSVR